MIGRGGSGSPVVLAAPYLRPASTCFGLFLKLQQECILETSVIGRNK